MRLNYPTNVKIVKLPCTGRVDILLILRAFESGVDGVYLAGCLEGECHFLRGNLRAKKRVQYVKGLLDEVGLGYLKLGQSATTLSGGEAQRVKLSRELSKSATGRTLYFLDEPTTGLHFADIEKLLKVLHNLVMKGNSVIVIEHNLDVIKTADWIVDLGPEGGDGGGEIIAVGTPEEVAANARSHTGMYLQRLLSAAS